MKCVVLNAPHQISVTERPDPVLRAPTDAILRVTVAGICGTDLHPYRGEIPGFRSGTVLGHEVCGTVVELGIAVRRVIVGDAVVVSDIIACGGCWYCRQGHHYQCDRVTLLGYDSVVGEPVDGGQAEYLRVPHADVTLKRIPDGVDHEDAVFVADVLSTGFSCARAAGPLAGADVAVVGCGPIGLSAIASARHLGAERIFAIDRNPRRTEAAEKLFGAIPTPHGSDALAFVAGENSGRGPDVVLEAVGSGEALTDAVGLVRPAGVVVAVGAHHETELPFNTKAAFGRELTLRFVVGDPIAEWDHLLPLVADGTLDPSGLVSHRLPLKDAASAYSIFDTGVAVKVLLKP